MSEPSFSDVNYFRHRAHTLSMGFFLRLDEYVEDFPTGTPLTLIELFKTIVKEIDTIVERTDNNALLNRICQILAELSAYALIFLDNAHTAQTPRGLVQMLERLRDKLYPDSLLLVAPQVIHNYTIWDLLPLLKDLTSELPESKAWDKIFQPFRGSINVVCFPRIERENILLHAIFGHEFGHPIADKFIELQERSPDYEKKLKAISVEVQKRYEKQLSEAPDVMRRFEIETKLVDDIEEIYQRALKELISDAVGTFLFGPSALFSAADVLIPGGLDDLPEDPDYYPPTRYRLRYMRRILEDQIKILNSIQYTGELEPIGSALRQFIKYIETLTDSDVDTTSLRTVPFLDIAYTWVESTLPDALAFAETACREICFSKSLIESQIPEAVSRLHLEVPPGEIGKFPNTSWVDWRTAMLAGWLHRIYVVSLTDKKWAERLEMSTTTQRLTLKGIEDCLLGEHYEKFVANGRK